MPLDLRWSCLTKLRSFEVTYLQSNVTWLQIFGFISISFVQFYSFPCFILLSSKSWRDDFCMPLSFVWLFATQWGVLHLCCWSSLSSYWHACVDPQEWWRDGATLFQLSHGCNAVFLVPRNSLVAWQVTPSPFTRPTSLCPLRPQRVGKWKMWKLWNRKHQETCVRGSFGIFFFYNAKRPSRRMVFRAIIHDPGSTGSGFGFGACGSFWRISGAKDVESKLQVETNASTSTTHFDVFISFGFIWAISFLTHSIRTLPLTSIYLSFFISKSHLYSFIS